MKKLIILLAVILLIGCEPEIINRIIITDSSGIVLFDKTEKNLSYRIENKGNISHIQTVNYRGDILFSISSEGLTITKHRIEIITLESEGL